MDHLNDLKKIILLKPREHIRQLIHINVRATLALLLRIGGLATIDVVWDWTALAEEVEERWRWVLECDDVFGFVVWLREVQVVRDGVLAALLGDEEVDCKVELAPSLVLAAEWWGVVS